MNTQVAGSRMRAVRLPSQLFYAAAGGILIGLARLVEQGRLYRSGSDFGYWLGVVGGVLMLALLLYPLRKRLRFMQRFGAMRSWFGMHMFLGVGGPLIILFHSTFSPGSLNGRIALYSMLVVAGSGLVGRFVYVRVHRGLHGRQSTLKEMQEELNTSEEGVKTLFDLAPNLGQRLLAYHDRALEPLASPLARAWRFMTMGWRGKWVAHECRAEMHRALVTLSEKRGWNKAKLQRRWGAARRRIDDHVRSVQSVAQFAAYERMFRLWHALHVPFLFLLVATSIVHIVAVHLY